jgi:hypothetical protein
MEAYLVKKVYHVKSCGTQIHLEVLLVKDVGEAVNWFLQKEGLIDG